jgi:8-amino-7-oxononanoate synthase
VDLDAFFAAQLQALEADKLRRALPAEYGPLLSFASNDYLGLSRHPALVEAARRATAEHGVGAGASRLLATDNAVVALEAVLAEWKQKEAALVFGSGYAAALGTIPALVGHGDTVILDKLAHASLIDGARLSGATVRTFPHNRADKLEALLQKISPGKNRVLIVTESVFSMDGDTAPLRKIADLKDRHGAWLLVDEAHATGLYGPTGAGLLEELGLSARVEIVLATLSKALGGVGGMIAGSRVLIDWLVNRARSFIYSTALPPGAAAASRAAVDLSRGKEGSALRARLKTNIDFFRSGLSPTWRERAPAEGAIQPLLCGEAAEALRLARAWRERGLFVPAIRYPTVPRRAARLRVTLSAAHTAGEIGRLHEALNIFPPDASKSS